MSTIQPVLVPSTATLADLHVTTNSSTPNSLHVYWGTALLQVIPRDKNALLFRISVGLLLNLKFRIGAVAKAFGVSEKPLRTWRDALKNGDLLSLGGYLDGLQTKGKLRGDVKRYIRVSYLQACEENGGRMPYGFRKQLCEQVAGIWPDQEVCEETLRQLFRDEDAVARSAHEVTAGNEKQQPIINVSEPVDLAPSLSQDTSTTADMERLSRRRAGDDNCKLSPDFSDDLRSDDKAKRELACDFYPSAGQESDPLDAGIEENQRAMPDEKYVENRAVIECDEIGDVPPLNSGKSSFAGDDNSRFF